LFLLESPMNRLAPNVPQLNTGAPITAAAWNRFVYSVGFHLRAPSALLAQTVSQSVASSTATRLAFDLAVRDTEGGHDPSNNSSRYTVKTAGTYLVSSYAFLNSSGPAGGEESVAIIVNEAVIWAIQLLPRDPGLAAVFFSCTAEIPLQIGDYVETQLWQDSGTAQSTTPSVGYSCWMGLHWVGV